MVRHVRAQKKPVSYKATDFHYKFKGDYPALLRKQLPLHVFYCCAAVESHASQALAVESQALAVESQVLATVSQA